MATIIFDFDGTIADTFEIASNIIINNAKYLKCKQLTKQELFELKDLHAKEVLKYLNIAFWRVPLFVRRLRKIANTRVDEINIFPSLFKVLQKLSLNNEIGLISSNSYKTVEFVLKKHNIFHYFNFIYCDKSLFGKKQCLNKLIKQRSLSPFNIYYVGDEVRDIEAAKAVKIKSVAITSGFNSQKRLELANPDYLITNVDDILNILIR